MHKQYAKINEDTCPPHRIARAIYHQCKNKIVFFGPAVKIGSIKPTKPNQTKEAAAEVRSIDVAIEQLVEFLKIYHIDAAPCSSHSAMNKMMEREAFPKGLLSQPEHTYLQNASGIRTVVKRHNLTNYLLCEQCMKDGTKHGETCGPMDFRYQCVAKFIICLINPDKQIKGRTHLPSLEAAKGDKPNVKEVYDYKYNKDFNPVENAVCCCVQLLEVFPEPVTCRTTDQFCNNCLIHRERNTGASGGVCFHFPF